MTVEEYQKKLDENPKLKKIMEAAETIKDQEALQEIIEELQKKNGK